VIRRSGIFVRLRQTLKPCASAVAPQVKGDNFDAVVYDAQPHLAAIRGNHDGVGRLMS
jgi:hypothetical protein